MAEKNKLEAALALTYYAVKPFRSWILKNGHKGEKDKKYF